MVIFGTNKFKEAILQDVATLSTIIVPLTNDCLQNNDIVVKVESCLNGIHFSTYTKWKTH